MAKILIDREIDPQTGEVYAEQFLDTDAPHTFHHPYDSSSIISLHDFLDLMNQDDEVRDKAGWNHATQLEGENSLKTRWQRLVEHTDSEQGDPKLKALKLIHKEKE